MVHFNGSKLHWTALRSRHYSEDMVRREIEIDEDTDRILTELASEYKGDLSLAERSEAAHEDALRVQRDRAEADFQEGRTQTWQDVKVRNGL